MINSIRVLSFFIMMLLLISCSNNERVYYKDNVSCTASNRSSEEWMYYRIELGNPVEDFNTQPSLMVRLKNGFEFRTENITLDDIENMKDCKHDDIVLNSTPPFPSWPEGAKQINCSDSLYFVINDNRICQISLVHQGEFRSVDDNKWHSLPCKESEIVEVFGKADKFYEWFRE